ncbi:MAG TPA: hypothetical protein V6D09_03145 [Leptolyngbyaceae cyanobacterium]
MQTLFQKTTQNYLFFNQDVAYRASISPETIYRLSHWFYIVDIK